MDYTIVVSGPAESRAHAEVALEDAGLPLLPKDHHALMDWRSKFPHDDDAFVTVVGKHPDQAVGALEGLEGWRLRVHYPTPEKPEPSPEQQFAATVADMKAEIEALKARLP